MSSIAILPALTILCSTCHQPLQRQSALSTPQTDEGPRIDVYLCEACQAGKVAVLFELDGAHVAPYEGWVQREVARRGAFFPSDYTRGGMRNW